MGIDAGGLPGRPAFESNSQSKIQSVASKEDDHPLDRQFDLRLFEGVYSRHRKKGPSPILRFMAQYADLTELQVS
jgi:hypothetical protein